MTVAFRSGMARCLDPKGLHPSPPVEPAGPPPRFVLPTAAGSLRSEH